MAANLRLRDAVVACVNSSLRDLQLLPSSVKTFPIGDGSGSGMDPKKGERDYLKSPLRDEIAGLPSSVAEERGIGGADLIPVIVSGGHGCGSGAGPALVNDLSRRYPEALVMAFSTLPLAYEGEGVAKRAWEALKRLRESAAATPVDNQYIAEAHRLTDAPITVLFDHINRRIAGTLSAMLKSMTSAAVKTIDSSDLRRGLGRGVFLPLFWRLPGPEALPELDRYDGAGFARLAKAGGGRHRVFVILDTASPVTPSQLEGMRDAIQRMLNARIDVKDAIVRGYEKRVSLTLLIGGVSLW